MAAKLGSFRHSFAERREREKLLSSSRGYCHLGFPYLEEEDEEQNTCLRKFRDSVKTYWKGFREFTIKVVDMGKSDPRKIVFAAKMALALVLISLLIFLKEPFEDISRYSVWAILTVVVVFEFSIGATLSKGFNRGLGTFLAGGLALGLATLSTLAGYWEEVVIIFSIFIIGFLATYLKLYPTLKPYEYGFRVFLLTYCYIMVSGYRTREFIHTAVTRFLLIAIGAAVCLGINSFIYPIWAGEDLHNLIVMNFMNIADSLEGCVNGYLNCIEYERIPSKILTYQASDDPLYNRYRSTIESTSQEDTLMSFAIWEPPHGPYKMFRYPWKSYTKVGGALRHCAFMVMALHGCILSELQAPAEKRQVFREELQTVGNEGAKLLREIGNRIKKTEKLGSVDILYEVHEAAEELQKKIDRKSYLLVNAENWEVGNNHCNDSDPCDLLLLDDHEKAVPVLKSPSDWEHDHGSLGSSKSFYIPHSINGTLLKGAHENMFRRQASMPIPDSLNAGLNPNEEDSKTYENASALSLATFATLLIEFVARLQNVVDTFEELSEKANFKDPTAGADQTTDVEVLGIWARLKRHVR